MRRGEYYVKPSVRKRLKSAKARSRKARYGM
jgi:ribosomal protein S21